MRTQHHPLSIMAVATIAFGILSCSNNVKEITIEEGFTDGYALRLPVEEIIRVPKDSITYAVVVDDLLCLFDNHRHHKDTPTIRISEISSPENYKGFIRYGIEKGETALPILSLSEGKILVYDPLLKRIAVLDARKAYQEEGYEPTFKETEIMTQRVSPFGDKVIFINSCAFEGKEPLVMFSDENWTSKKRDNVGSYHNVMSGELFTDDCQTRIGCSREGIPELSIFDDEAKPLIKLTFPHKPLSFQKIELENGNYEYLRNMDEKINDCFYAGCGGKEIFSLVYDDEKRNEQMVLVFNWKGDILDGFMTGGTIERVSLSSDGMSLYAWERIGDEFFLNKYPVMGRK